MSVDIGEAFKISGDTGIGQPDDYSSIGSFISKIIPNVYVVAGIILFALVLGGGFAILTSSGNPDQQNKGGNAVTAALVGFLIIFASYWLVQIVEHLTGVKIFDPGV
jgi:Zn-dependent protease with chaperone function